MNSGDRRVAAFTAPCRRSYTNIVSIGAEEEEEDDDDS